MNAKLQRIFGQLGYVEQTGHGIPLIISKYGMQAFEITENFVNVIIPLSRALIETAPKQPVTLNPSQLKVYEYLKVHPEATIQVLVSECSISKGYAQKILGFLKANDYIRRSGSNKSGKWIALI